MVYHAVKTLDAIAEAMYADQGNSFRKWQGIVLPHIGDAYREDEDPFRSHMGASGIGRECPREIWYNFRWAVETLFEGRMLRLFNRGHLEEGRFIAMLLMIGVQVYQQDEDGNQFRISHCGGHFGGSGDGYAFNIPDLDPGTQCLLEFKTSGSKYFGPLKKNGVKKEKQEHFAQMQTYMRKMNIPICLYMCVNKDTDEIHAEFVVLETEVADQYFTRAERLVFLPHPPEKVSENAGWYKCKFCDYRKICHFKKTPYVSCRSCIHAKIAEDGTWQCSNQESEHAGQVLDKKQQLSACRKYSRAF